MSRQTIWNLLKEKGFSDVAAAGIMGNMEAESNCESNRLQGDFGTTREKSINYTKQVDEGYVSRDDFIYNGPNGGGYGLCQWTYYSRKAGLYDLAKMRGLSIASEDVQIEWLCNELAQGEYASVLQTLRTSGSIRECSDAVLKGFEKPADQGNIQSDIRAGYAEGVYELYHGDGDTVAPAGAGLPQSTSSTAPSNEGAPQAQSEETIGVLPKTMIRSEVQAKACLIALYLKDILKLLEEIEV